MTESQIIDHTLVRWYAVADDLIGGYLISNVNKPASKLIHGEGDYYLGDFLNKEVAEYIVGLHNYLHRSRFPEQWEDQND